MYLFRFIESMTKKEEPQSQESSSQTSPIKNEKPFKTQGNATHKTSSTRTFDGNKSFQKNNNDNNFRQEGKKSFQKYEKKSFTKPDNEQDEVKNHNQENKIESAYVLFSANGESFLGIYKNNKRTFKLDGIEHPEKTGYYSNIARNFINQQIKKKVVYLTIKGEDEEGRLIVDAFLDKEKTQCLNTMMIEEQLHQVKKKTYSKKSNFNNHAEKRNEPDTQTKSDLKNHKSVENNQANPGLASYHDYSMKSFQHLGNMVNFQKNDNEISHSETVTHQNSESLIQEPLTSVIDNQHLPVVNNSTEFHGDEGWNEQYDEHNKYEPVFNDEEIPYSDSYDPVSEDEYFNSQPQEFEEEHHSFSDLPITNDNEASHIYEKQSEPETIYHKGDEYAAWNDNEIEYDQQTLSHQQDECFDEDMEASDIKVKQTIHTENQEDNFFDELMSVETYDKNQDLKNNISSKTHNVESIPTIIQSEQSEQIASSDSSIEIKNEYRIEDDPFMKELLSVFNENDESLQTKTDTTSKNKLKFR